MNKMAMNTTYSLVVYNQEELDTALITFQNNIGRTLTDDEMLLFCAGFYYRDTTCPKCEAPCNNCGEPTYCYIDARRCDKCGWQ